MPRDRPFRRLLEIEAPWLLRLVACSGGDIVMIKGSKVDVMDVVDAKDVSSIGNRTCGESCCSLCYRN